MKKLIFTTVLTAACITVISAYPSSTIAPKINLTLSPCLDPDSSSTIQSTWQSVLDSRGDPIDFYVLGIFQNNVNIIQDSTNLLTRTHNIPCPQFGDSDTIQAEIYAVDVRGNEGQRGISNSIVLHTNDPGPPAPVITIDTIASTLGPIDSIQLYAFDTDTVKLNRFIATNTLFIPEKIQLCPIVYRVGIGRLPVEYISKCVLDDEVGFDLNSNMRKKFSRFTYIVWIDQKGKERISIDIQHPNVVNLMNVVNSI